MNKKLTFRERMACAVLSKLKYNSNDEFYKCHWNDCVLALGCLLLKGRDPIEFIEWVLDIDPNEPALANLR